MNLVQLTSTDKGSVEFLSLLDDIHPDVEKYSFCKNAAQKMRMIVIGKISDFIQDSPQRSKEHKLLVDACEEEGWSRSTRSQSLTAYHYYKELMSGEVTEYQALADAASFSQLFVLASNKNTNLQYDVAVYLKKHKELPPVTSMKGYVGGFFDSNFQSKGGGRSSGTRAELSAVPVSVATIPAPAPIPVPVPIESFETIDIVASPVPSEEADAKVLFTQLETLLQRDRKSLSEVDTRYLNQIVQLLDNYGYGKSLQR